MRTALAALTLTVFISPAIAQAAEKIRWLFWDQVPTHIQKGQNKGKGTGDLLLEKFQAALSDFDHVNLQVNMPRYHREITKPNTCVALAWLTRLEAGMARSRPHSIGVPVGIMVRSDRSGEFGPSGKQVSLAELLNREGLRLGGLANFFYSEQIDQMLKSHPRQENIRLLKPDEIALDLKLLDYGRVDYILGWNAQLANYRDNGGDPSRYLFYPVQEAPVHVRYYAHCQNDTTGRAVINRLNDLMSPDFLAWLREVNSHWVANPTQFRQLYNHHILEGRPHPDIRDREELTSG